VWIHGVEGIGKSALLDCVRDDAAARGWRCGSGIVAEVEGARPYAPVLEAMADLARSHPTVMDALDDAYREEIERALGDGQEVRWLGVRGRQRLFVATAELLRVAAAGTGMALVVDGVHDADEATLRMLHYLARTAANERALLVLAHRPVARNDALQHMRNSLLTRGTAVDVPLSPLTQQGTGALLATALGRDPRSELTRRVHTASAGIPRRILSIARTMLEEGATSVPPNLDTARSDWSVGSPLHDTMRQVAVLGTLFDTDEFVAVTRLDDETAYGLLDDALARGLLARTDFGFRMQPVTREELLHDLPQHRRRVLHRNAANALVSLEAPRARIGHHLLHAGESRAAVPHILAAAETAAALGAHREALRLVDSVRAVADGPHRARLLRMRADLLLAVGDRGAVAAFREAVEAAAPSDVASTRARLAQAAAFAGDLDTAREALAGLDTNADTADVSVLLAKGNVAYFSGDLDGAAAASRAASERVGAVQSLELLDLVSLQGLVAHDRGELFTRLYHELRRTKEAPTIATAVFDAHLCVAEYLLYGLTPYDEVISLAGELKQAAERTGALRAVAFAATLVGEAALLSGDLAVAERELNEAVDLHREIGAAAGEAHSLQRLAELRLYQGDRNEARVLLSRAVPLARWSLISMHLLQRIHGTIVRAADDVRTAREMVDRAEVVLGMDEFCNFCQVMFSVPAAIACAEAGDVVAAHHHLAMAQRSAAFWRGTAWEAATLEAEAHTAMAEGNPRLARQLMSQARSLFEVARQPLDAARCSQTFADQDLTAAERVEAVSRTVPAARGAEQTQWT
jgi:tetratricopeptide (TPR) repeat protein